MSFINLLSFTKVSQVMNKQGIRKFFILLDSIKYIMVVFIFKFDLYFNP